MKKFLIIGNQNAVTFKEIFPLIKENKVWLGVNNGSKIYRIPFTYTHIKDTFKKNEEKYSKLGNTGWFTNLEHKKRHQKHILFRTYNGNETEYPKYDNYDAINVEKSVDIPYDYYGVIGVPISFLDKICPEQFEIMGIMSNNTNDGKYFFGYPYIDKIKKYARLLIRRIDLDDKEFYGLD